MPICGISCYGELWNIPYQDKTYEYRTQLRPSIFNEMSLEYLALIDKEARRNLDDVANEMDLINIIRPRGSMTTKVSVLDTNVPLHV